MPDGPKYAAIAADLRQQIEARDLPPGAWLPSSRELMERHHASLMTVRQAIDVLVWEGLVVVIHGTGVRVREYRRIRSDRIRRLSADQWGNGSTIWAADVEGRDLRVEDVQVQWVAPPGHVAALLGLPDGDAVLRRSRTFVVDGRPVQMASNWLPGWLVAGTAVEDVDTGPGGTYARLRDLGHEPVSFAEEVVARMPSRDQAEILQIAPGTPAIEVRRVAEDASGRVVEVAEMLIDSSVFMLIYAWAAER